MKNYVNVIILLALVISVALIAIWQFTGGDYYTKFEVIEQIEQELDPDDPLVAAGFYDNKQVTETVVKKEFHLGLLPTPTGLLDKHILSVVSLAVPFWIIAIAAKIWQKRRRKSS